MAPCEVSPEKVNALRCKVKTIPIRYNWANWAHSTFVQNKIKLTYEIFKPPGDCEKSAKNNKITIEDGYTHEPNIKMDESIQQHANQGTSLDAEILHTVSHYHAQNS